MKILHISSAKGWGGNEQQIINIIPELELLGTNNIVLLNKGSRLEEECKKINIDFVCAEKTKKNKITIYPYFKKLIKDINPDVIHLHTSDFLTIYMISDFFYHLKTPVVYSRKSILKTGSLIGRLKYNYRNISALICVSEKVRYSFSKKLNKNSRKKTHVIYDCIPTSILENKSNLNLREKYNIPNENLIIGNVANHNRAKDLMIMVETADYLINILGTKNVCFIQIGEFTELTTELQNKVIERRLENHFVFTGKIQEAYRFNHQFDVFLMTSEREGGPTALLEAMYVEKPIVSTNVGIVPEIIKNGKNGYISDVKDYVSLAENLNILIKDPQKRKDIVKGNKELIIKNNSSKVIAQKTLQLYKEIAK